MSPDYAKCAREIYEAIGGKQNLLSADHCATRLRLTAKECSEAELKRLESIEGVKGVFSSNGQIHLIIGMDGVAQVSDAFAKISGIMAENRQAADRTPETSKVLSKVSSRVLAEALKSAETIKPAETSATPEASATSEGQDKPEAPAQGHSAFHRVMKAIGDVF